MFFFRYLQCILAVFSVCCESVSCHTNHQAAIPSSVTCSTSVRVLACSKVMAHMFPSASRSRIVFSSRSHDSTTSCRRNSIYRVSVSLKYFTFMVCTYDRRMRCALSCRQEEEPPSDICLPFLKSSTIYECARLPEFLLALENSLPAESIHP
jgi:hypothetical protein